MTFSAWVQKWINQITHVFAGAYLVGLMYQRAHLSILYSALVAVVFATGKEGVFDPLTETKVLKGSGWEDWLFWMLGIGLGIITFR